MCVCVRACVCVSVFSLQINIMVALILSHENIVDIKAKGRKRISFVKIVHNLIRAMDVVTEFFTSFFQWFTLVT